MGDGGLGMGDGGWGMGDGAQSQIPNPQSPYFFSNDKINYLILFKLKKPINQYNFNNYFSLNLNKNIFYL